MTASTEITQNASKSANGYKTILTNLMTKDLEKQFNEFGLTMRDSNGALKDGYAIIQELSGVYQKLGTVWNEDDDAMVSMNDNFNALMEDISGKHNINVLVSGLQNFDQAINATNSALNSAGSAQSEFETAMGGLSKKIEGLKGQFQELVWGDGGLNNLLKLLVDLGTGILKFANSDLGQTIIVMGSTYLALTLLVKGYNALKASTIATTIATKGLSAALSTLNINPIILAITAVVGVVYGAIKAIDYFTESLEESQQKLSELNSEYSSANSNIESIKTQLEDLYSKIKDINSEDGVKVSKDGELENLVSQTTELERQLAIEQERARIAQQDIAKEAQKTVYSQVEDYGAFGNQQVASYEGVMVDAVGSGTRLEAIDAYSKKMADLKPQIESLIKAQTDLVASGQEESEQYATNSNNLSQLQNEYDIASSNANTYLEELQNETSELNENNEIKQDVINAEKQYSDALITTSDSTDEASQATSNFTDDTKKEKEGLSESEQALENAKTSLEEYKDALSDLSSMDDAFITLNDAIAEYNSSGEFTLDTLDNLLSLGDEYLALLEFENGQVSLNKDGALALANAKIDEAEAKAYSSAMAELNASAQNEEAGAIDNASASARASVSANVSASNGVYNAITACAKGTVAWNNYWSAQSRGVIKNGASNDKTTAIGKSLNLQLKALESLRGNLGKATTATTASTKATNGSTGATKSNTSALDANKKALEAQKKALEAQKKALENQKKAIEDSINDYERVISYLEDKVNDYIDELEEAKDKELAVVDQQIDAIKEKQDAEDKYWEDKINALKEQNDALEDQIELQELLDNLAKAKANKKMVYREGQGFVYEADQQEVSKAQQELNDYYRKKSYEDQLKQLEDFRDSANENYEQQIKDLEDYQKEIEKKYENQIQYYKDWIDDFKTQVDKYKDEQDRLLALQLTGIDTEQANWTTRLTNLGSFVDSYTTKLSELDTVQSKIDALETAIESLQTAINSLDYSNLDHSVGSGGGGGGGGNSSSTTTSQGRYKATVTYNGSHPVAWNGSHYQAGDVVKEFTDTSPSALNSTLQSFLKKYQSAFLNGLQTTGIHAYASGTIGTENDGIALVGDNPNYNELVIGSKLNGAKMLNMSSNTGVIPHNLTSTLIQMASSFNDGMMNLQPNNTSNATNVSIGNISLPSVQNGQDFVDYLQNFSANMTQLAYSRI